MTRQEAKKQIEEWVNLKTYKVKDPNGNFIREFEIGPSDPKLAQEWSDQKNRVRKLKESHGFNAQFDEKPITFEDCMVWVQITDYGLSTFVPLDDFLLKLNGSQHAYRRQIDVK